MRVNYAGELGWECYHPICHQHYLYDGLTRAGQNHGLKMVGNRAIESARPDKSYRAMYRDLNIEHAALESGLERFVCLDKDWDFIGRKAIEAQKSKGLGKKLVTLKVQTTDASAYMNEGVYYAGRLVGRVSPGTHSYHFGHAVSMAYLERDYSGPGTRLEISVPGVRCAAVVVEDAPYGPENIRPKM